MRFLDGCTLKDVPKWVKGWAHEIDVMSGIGGNWRLYNCLALKQYANNLSAQARASRQREKQREALAKRAK